MIRTSMTLPSRIFGLTLLLLLMPLAAAQEKKDEPKGKLKPYAEVVTKEAITQDGLVKVHEVDDKVFFEIPKDVFGRELLIQAELAQLPQNLRGAYPGAGIMARVVRFVRRGNKVY